jgi:hypothetical protein
MEETFMTPRADAAPFPTLFERAGGGPKGDDAFDSFGSL